MQQNFLAQVDDDTGANDRKTNLALYFKASVSAVSVSTLSLWLLSHKVTNQVSQTKDEVQTLSCVRECALPAARLNDNLDSHL